MMSGAAAAARRALRRVGGRWYATGGGPDEAAAVVVGGGIAGLATAYRLAALGAGRVVVVTAHAPLTLTSAMSTECYRDFWPSPTMAALMGDSIDGMEALAAATDNAFSMTRRGYAYFTKDAATLARVEAECAALAAADPAKMPLRRHDGTAAAYKFGPVGALVAADLNGDEGDAAPRGLDVLIGSAAVRAVFPAVAPDVVGCVHARRAGWVSAQQRGAAAFVRRRVRTARARRPRA